MFSYIIYAETEVDDTSKEVSYRFKTRTDGNDTCRSVQGCFKEKYVEPNLKYIIDRINQFEEFGEEEEDTNETKNKIESEEVESNEDNIEI